MSETNLTAVIYGKEDIRMEERPIPEPGPADVLLAIQCVGICGSDLSTYAYGDLAGVKITGTLVPGHEGSAKVVKLGEAVTQLKVGDVVAVDAGIPCTKCEYCKCGRYNLCTAKFHLSIPPDMDGMMCRYLVHPAEHCFKLPDDMSSEEGALVEPMDIGVYACKRAGVSLGKTVLICGAGPIGLSCMLVSKACGASKVCITDMLEYRVKFAVKAGADKALLVDGNDALATAKRVEEALGAKPDITIECTGAQDAINTGIYATKSGGGMLLVGLAHKKIMEIPMLEAALREVQINSMMTTHNSFDDARGLLASGRVNVKQMVTHHFPLEQAAKAFHTAYNKQDGCIKVMVDCAQGESLG